MLRAVFFDFNGVLVDDEPLHCALFQKTLAHQGVRLSEKDYYEKYLGFDDKDAFTAVLKDQNLAVSPEMIQTLIETKSKFYDEEMARKDLFVPGAVDFVKKISEKYFLGVVSGALRREIAAWLKKGGIADLLPVIVAAEDIQKGKPDPEGYLRGLDHLNRDFVPSSEMILPQECLVIEDSRWGIEAAHGAGMKCVGFTTSYSAEELKIADWVISSFSEIPMEKIAASFQNS
ncbi:MAG: HAD family phosphatase [bacterium]